MAAVQIPLKSEGDLRNAFERAAADVRACAAGGASGGRLLKSWGAEVASATPPEGLQVSHLENICSNAAKAKSGETLPEMDEWGTMDALAAAGLGAAQGVLAGASAIILKVPNPECAFLANSAVEQVLSHMFYEKNEEQCQSQYGDAGCRELAVGWATGLSPAVSEWAGTDRPSDACKSCGQDLLAICLRHMAEYNKNFSLSRHSPTALPRLCRPRQAGSGRGPYSLGGVLGIHHPPLYAAYEMAEAVAEKEATFTQQDLETAREIAKRYVNDLARQSKQRHRLSTQCVCTSHGSSPQAEQPHTVNFTTASCRLLGSGCYTSVVPHV